MSSEREKPTYPTGWVIGSDLACDLVVLADTISSRHCRLDIAPDGTYTLEDLESESGTFVNGRRIHTPVTVQKLDLITLGTSVPFPWPPPALNGGARILKIGRLADNDIVLSNNQVSGHHARILIDNGQAIIEDLFSTNGTAIGDPARKVRRAVIEPGDTVFFGTLEVAARELIGEKIPVDPAKVLAKTRSLLIELGIVSVSEWERATKGEAEIQDLDAILDQLEKMPASWCPDKTHPVLTRFQSRYILESKAVELRVGDYILIERLGGGGMGEVFKAWSLKRKQIVALKTLRLNGDSGLTASDARKRFQREANILHKLNHPCITQYYEHDGEGLTPYLAMEYVEGRDLSRIVAEAKARGQKVPVDWAVDATMMIADALEHAHQLGVVHRDIKPANIMVTRDGSLKVLDMGIARATGGGGLGPSSTLTQVGTGIGTPEFMSPEQWKDARNVTASTDIYSLGCTLYFLLTGEPPFSGSLRQMLLTYMKAPPPKVTEKRPEVTKGTERILLRMMAKSPDERYSSAEQVIEAFQASRRKSALNPLMIAGIVLCIAAVSLLLFWYFRM